MADCLFCRIVAGEIPAKVVKRTADALAFHDVDPKAPIHVLVIPTRHVPAVRDLKGADGEALLGRLMAFAAEVAASWGWTGEGYRIVTNTGQDAGQSVDHLHVHVMGGTKVQLASGVIGLMAAERHPERSEGSGGVGVSPHPTPRSCHRGL